MFEQLPEFTSSVDIEKHLNQQKDLYHSTQNDEGFVDFATLNALKNLRYHIEITCQLPVAEEDAQITMNSPVHKITFSDKSLGLFPNNTENLLNHQQPFRAAQGCFINAVVHNLKTTANFYCASEQYDAPDYQFTCKPFDLSQSGLDEKLAGLNQVIDLFAQKANDFQDNMLVPTINDWKKNHLSKGLNNE